MRALALALAPALALALVPTASAADVSFLIDSDMVDGRFYWFDEEGGRDPDYVLPAGKSVEITVHTRSGLHNLRIRAPVGVVSADVDPGGQPSTTLAFTTPLEGTALFVCDYHTTMDGTMTFSAAATEVQSLPAKAEAPALPALLLLAAVAALAVARGRR